MRHSNRIIAVFLTGLFVPLVAMGAPKDPAAAPGPGDAVVNAVLGPNGCSPAGTPKNDVITCVGIDLAGTASGRGDDSIHIVSGASVLTVATDPQPQTTTVDGGQDNDTITNDGAVRAQVFSLGASLKEPPALGAGKDVAQNSAADDTKMAQATGIAGGDGNDTITNNGTIDVGTIVNTSSLGLSGPPPGPAPKTRASEAISQSIGIDGGAGNDVIVNTGEINVTATSLVEKLDVASDSSTFDAEASKNKDTAANATAIGVSGGDGGDQISNSGHLSVTASTAAITIAPGGSSGVANPRSDHGSTFEATATGVDAGAGDDTITNTNAIDVVAEATAPTVGVSLTIDGTHPAVSGSTAKAASTGIDAGDGSDTVSNQGEVTATAEATAAGLFGSVVPQGGGPLFKASASGSVAADASATGIAGAEGADTITNDGLIQAQANAKTLTGAGAIAIDSAAEAEVTSRAKADAIGIDAGAGDDTVINRGQALEATATADATSLSIAFSQSGTADVKSAEDGGTSAEASATGIVADSDAADKSSETNLTMTPAGLTLVRRTAETASGGADTLTNETTINATADAHSGAKGAAVSIDGAAHASSTSSAKAQATAIDAGAGSDTVTNANQGVLNADATASADAVNVAFSEKGEAIAAHDAGATAEASATGIAGDGTAADTVSETTLTIGTDGLSVTHSTSTTAAGGDDTLSNDGTIAVDAHALSGAVAGAISIQGAAQADTTSKSKSTATGIDGGAGADTVTNGGEINADATANAGALNIAFSQGGSSSEGEATKAKSSVEGGASAEASATGVAGDGSASQTTTENSLAITAQGLSVSRHTSEQAIGGNDTLDNQQSITATADALSLAGGGAISIDGAAEASTTSNAKAGATGIDAGAGDDTVTNGAALTAEATANAGALNVAFSQKGEANAKHDGGAVAEAAATGMSGDGAASNSETETALGIDTDGLHFLRSSSTQSVGGADMLVNDATIDATSTANSGSRSGAISIEGAAQADSTSKAKSVAVAMDAGAGGDVVTNSEPGELTAEATARAGALNVAFSQKEGAKATHDGGATAEASATGMAGDGAASSSTSETTVDIGTSALHVAHRTEETAIGGADTLTNDGTVNATATALSLTGAAAISIQGAAQAGATSTAKANATGIDAGIGEDTVTSRGAISADATANAGALNIAFSEGGSSSEGESTKAKSSVEGSATAEANATGIAGDGTAGDRTSETTLDVEAAGLQFAYRTSNEALGADDTLTNENTISATATARSGEISGAISVEGAAQANSTSTAKSTAAAIDGGGGGDEIVNGGALTAEATSVAFGLSAAVSSKKTATAAEGLWDGGSTAEATAIGIAGDGSGKTTSSETTVGIDFQAPRLDVAYRSLSEGATGSDSITNNARIDATATAVAPAVDVAISSEGMAAAVSTASAKARAAAIDAGGADDDVINHGDLYATAVANADAISVAVSSKKEAIAADTVWNGGTQAQAVATGIDADGTDARNTTEVTGSIDAAGVAVNFRQGEQSASGADSITNDAMIQAGATAVSVSADVAVAAEGVAGAISTSEATSQAAAINAGGGGDEVTNKGALTAKADAVAVAVNVAVSGKSAAIAADALWNGGVTADATAKGIDADGTATDKLSETRLTIDGDGVGISHSSSETSAGGNDTISNESTIDANAVAVAPSADVAVAAKGVAGAVSTATAKSNAVAIDGGVGDDTITNADNGQLTAHAESTAVAVNLAISGKTGAVAADAVWDGGTTADASAKGIDADGSAANSASDTTLTINGDGVVVSHGSSVTNVSGSDAITNDATIDASAVAVVPSVSAAISVKGTAVAASAATAKAGASAIDAGDAGDTVTNSGKLTAGAVASADAVNVAVTTEGVAGAGGAIWGGDTTADATSKGIDLDGSGVSSGNETTLTINSAGVGFSHSENVDAASGNDTLANTGAIESTATAVSAGVAVGVAVEGGAAATSSSVAKSSATGIDAGGGDDGITNGGKLTATATSTAVALNVAVEAGAGGAVAADAVWDGGTTAEASAKGIDADGSATSTLNGTTITIDSNGARIGHSESTTSATGADTITNDGKIKTAATAVAPSVGVAIAVSGVGVAAATSTAKAQATAIDGGAGNDGVTNRGELDVNAVANADAVNVAVAPEGGAIAGNNVWNGGTTSEAIAKGIDADGSGTNTTSETTLAFGSNGASFVQQTATDVATGDDTIHNEAKIDTDAVAVTGGIAVGVTAEGGAAAISTSTAKTQATAIDAGDGSDVITNTADGELTAGATSVAVALNVGVAAGTGLAVAADAVWDGGTTAEASAKGIDADGTAISRTGTTTIAVGSAGASIGHSESTTSASGDDTITNDAKVGATATAVAPSVSVAVAVSGVGVAASTATATADATAIDGGAGNDSITNHGDLDASAVANADAVNVAVTPAGGAIAGNNVWNGGTTSEATAKGIDSDGAGTDTTSETTLAFGGNGASFSQRSTVDPASGNDTVVNDAKIDASAVTVSPEVAVAVAVEGAAAALSNSTARAAASAIDTGGGDDSITNHGELDAGAVANADTVNVSGSNFGVNVAANAVWDGGTTAEAVATGIDADGKGTHLTKERSITLNGNGIEVLDRTTRESASGNDTIANDAKIDAHATAVTVSLSAAAEIPIDLVSAGLAVAVSTSTAKSDATAIDAGGGDDTVMNSGELDATATSVAVTGNLTFSLIGVAASVDALWEGGTTAEAVATGIDADGAADKVTTERRITANGSGIDYQSETTTESLSGNDNVTNSGKIVATATAVSPSVAIGVAGILGAAGATSMATSRAVAIDAGGGDDTVDNSGELQATADSTAVAVNVSAGAAGLSVNNVWDGGVRAEATTRGIDGGSGNDTIANSAHIESTATATAPSVSVALGGIIGAAISTATTEADASAINAGGGDDAVDNSGELTATANSTAVAVNVSQSGAVALSVNNVWDGGTRAQATAKGIDTGGGKDTVNNVAATESMATATVPAVSVAFGGIVGAAVSTATGEARASAIDTGDDADSLVNSGELTATADANAVAVNVSVTMTGLAVSADATWNGGTTADAGAKGIDGGKGSDEIANTALINANADADSTSVGVSLVTMGGVGASISTSTAKSQASAIDGGDDNDTIANTGRLVTVAGSTATGVNVSVSSFGASIAADAVWNGGTTADAVASGIDGGSGDDTIDNAAQVDSTAMADSTSVGVSATVGLVAGATSTATATTQSTAIDAGAGNDRVDNTGTLTAIADSSAGAVSVSVTEIGIAGAFDAVWDGGTTAEATAKGIAGGDGEDVLNNQATITAHSTADTDSTGVAVTIAGVAGALSRSTAETAATALDGGEAGDTITNLGELTAIAESSAKAVSVGVTLVGATVAADAIWDGGTTADATARGIDGGGGNDFIDNRQAVTAMSTADAVSTGVSIDILGAAGAVSAATANAQSTAIDGGAGDDTIANSADLNANATANVTGTSVSVSLVGFAGSDMSSTANAAASGIQGGDGSNIIGNSGHLTVDASATATGASVSVSVVGASLVDPVFDGDTTAQATAVGLAGGAGVDAITNVSAIDLTAAANAASTGVSVGLIGFAGANAAATATASATGIDGGGDADVLDNQGTITSTVTADSPAHAVGVNLAGASFVNASSTANANAIGMNGGEGNDAITNSGMITSTVTAAHSPVRSVSVNLAGVASADFSSTAQANAIGIEGGQGNDVIANDGEIDISASASAPASAVSVGIFGVGEQNAGATANATATGIDGGDGNDEIANIGSVKAHATADALVKGSSWNVAGVARQQGLSRTVVRATGIAGGNGIDMLANGGSLDVGVNSTLTTQGASTTIFGGTSADAQVSGDLAATGIAGGDDGDHITNTGSATVDATAVMQANGSSWTVGGSARSSAGIDSTTSATGIDGGNGADVIANSGTMDAETSSTASASSASWSLAGSAGGSAGMTSDAIATGIDGGDGADAITNNSGGLVKANATANTTVDGSSWTLAGKSTDSGTLSASVKATGVNAGIGDDTIHNDGSVSVEGTGHMTITGGSSAIFGGAGSGSSVAADVNTTGIDGNSGSDWIESTGSVDVTSTTTMSSSKASFSFAGGASSGALLSATSAATGIAGGDDADWIHNAGVLTVLAQAQQTASGGSSVTLAGSSASSASSSAQANALGVDGGDGADTVINDGNITVSANPRPSTAASTVTNTAGAGFIFGSAGSVSGIGLASTSRGVSLGEGDNVLANNNSLNTVAGGDGSASADADGARLVNGDAAASATATASATAYGVQAASGENMIVNAGSMNVLANPRARASASANGNGADGDGTASAHASATGLAIGIEVGGGNNSISNGGSLTVSAAPTASASAAADSDLGGAAVASATSSASATAIGIHALTGSGHNDISNDGTIDVSVSPSVSASAGASADSVTVCDPFGLGICGTVTIGTTSASRSATASAAAYGVRTDGQGDQHIVNNGAISVTAPAARTAVGIQTGSGNDTIVNNGRIETAVGSGEGVAISAGAGDDVVTLGDGSFTQGNVDLGSGNNTLQLIGTPILNSGVTSGSGTNSLIFDGSGSFSSPVPGFAIATKQGAGTFTVPTLSTMQRLEMNEGTLQINNSYTMSPAGVFQAQVNGDGTNGQLKSTGTVGLGGNLVVVKGPGAYTDGTQYDIVSASNVSGSFASETLPAPTAVLSFNVNQLPTAVQVQSSVIPFSALAPSGNQVQGAVANQLDTLAPTATGDMSVMLGSLQELSASELTTAFASLSPDSFDNFTTSTLSTARRYVYGARDRMANLRAGASQRDGSMQSSFLTGDAPLFLSTTASGGGFGDAPGYSGAGAPYGGWYAGFGGDGAQTTSQNGFQGFNYDTNGTITGFDYPLGNRAMAGFSFGSAVTGLSLDQQRGEGEIDGFFGSAYATYFSDNGVYLDSVFSYGRNNYHGARNVTIGSTQRTAYSNHQGDMVSAFLETGKGFAAGAWNNEVFGALGYALLNERAFQESGAGSADLAVDARQTQSLQTELGWRTGRRLSLRKGVLAPELSAAWVHDFNIDGHLITARFVDSPNTPFTLVGRQPAGDGARLRAGLSFFGHKGFSLSARVEAELNSNQSSDVAALIQGQLKF